MPDRGVKNKNEPESSVLEPEAKRSRLDVETSSCQSQESTLEESIFLDSISGPTLDSLSDDVLLHILSFVGPSDLLSLAECNERLHTVAKDRSLWRTCDLRPRILSLSRLHSVLHWLQPTTTVFACCGPVEIMSLPIEVETVEPTWLLSFMILLSKYAPNLKTLIIENHIIDCNKILIEDFPPSIENLNLKNCVLRNLPVQSSYFFGIHSSLTQLKALDLTDSSWFVPHSLLALSKCNTLEELVLDGCDVSECLPYVSLATNYGFANLKVLDLRNTLVGDVEVSCFNKMKALRHLYISAPETDPPELTYHVTDLSITTFGDDESINRAVVPLQGFYQIRVVRPPPCLLQSLLLNNYRGITDFTLRHIAGAMAELNFLDVSHTDITLEGLSKFKMKRPEITLISSFPVDTV